MPQMSKHSMQRMLVEILCLSRGNKPERIRALKVTEKCFEYRLFCTYFEREMLRRLVLTSSRITRP